MHYTMPILLADGPLPWLVGVLVLIVFAAIVAAGVLNSGGNVPGVIKAIIAAHRADIDLDFDRAAAIDLAGRDVLDAVQTSVYPKVIDCPDPRRSHRTTLSAIAKNGVELKVCARVTART